MNSNLVAELKERTVHWQVVASLIWKVAKACEAAGMEETARDAFAASLLVLDEHNDLDKAISVLTEDGIKTVQLTATCSKCQKENRAVATLNVALPVDDRSAKEWKCANCGADLGHVRNDKAGIPEGFSLTITSASGVPIDHRPLTERLSEAEGKVKPELIDTKGLPSSAELKAAHLGVEDAAAVIHSSASDTRRRSIKDMQEAVRAKMGNTGPQKVAADDANDF